MTETSTPTSNSTENDMVQKKSDIEDLSDEEQYFYSALCKRLNSLNKMPSPEVVSRILSYSLRIK